MRAISLWQPWATLVAIGAKRLETRAWEARYSGPLVIHASARWTREQARLSAAEPFRTALMNAGYSERPSPMRGLPVGAIVGVVELISSVQIDSASVYPEPERSFGNYTPGRWAWILINARRINRIPFRGRQKWFDVPDDLIAAALAEAA